jgi:hypothetical protein
LIHHDMEQNLHSRRSMIGQPRMVAEKGRRGGDSSGNLNEMEVNGHFACKSSVVRTDLRQKGGPLSSGQFS